MHLNLKLFALDLFQGPTEISLVIKCLHQFVPAVLSDFAFSTACLSDTTLVLHAVGFVTTFPCHVNTAFLYFSAMLASLLLLFLISVCQYHF